MVNRGFIIGLVMILAGLTARSQEVGVRLGDIVGNNIALDLVYDGHKHRQHVDVSFGNGIGVEWLVDFVIAPLGRSDFDYYIGAGPFAWFGDPFTFGVCGELGAEYRIPGAPLVIGLDWRPAIPLYREDRAFIGSRSGLNVRYIF